MKNYNINEFKKAEIDTLSAQVLDAQLDVEQQQAIVTALTSKAEKFAGFLSDAEANRTRALSNQNLVDDVLQQSLDLMNATEVAHTASGLAFHTAEGLATEVNDVIKKLIYAAEHINKLANIVIRKKAINPLISDELVATIGTAGTDANNAVALTLVALKSTFTSQASGGEAEAASALTYLQAKSLYDVISGNGSTEAKEINLTCQLNQAYNDADAHYVLAQEATKDASAQLNKALSKLQKAAVKLQSLESGLAAAKAAAMAT